MPRQFLVVIHRPGPSWQANVPAFEQDGLGHHLQHYAKLKEDGHLEMGGPFVDPASGGMMFVRDTMQPDEVLAYASSDPCVESGLLRFDIRPWLIGIE